MTQQAMIAGVEQRAVRATVRDGITELLLGLTLLFFGVVFYLAPPLGAFGALLPFALNPLGRLLKNRFVYPRTGYAKLAERAHAVRGILITAVAAIAILLASWAIFGLHKGWDIGTTLWMDYFIPAFAGLLMAIGPWTVAHRFRLVRWYFFAASFVVGGVLIPVLGIASGYSAVALQSSIVGGLSVVYGVGLFLSFIHRHPVQEAYDGAE